MRRELGARIASLLRRPARRRASGRFGGRGEYWKVLRNISGALEQTGELFALLALGLVPDEVMDNFVDAELIPTREPGKAKLRPLNLLPFPRRGSMSAVVKQAKAQIVAAVGPDQVAIGVPDGCTRIYCAASAQLRLDRSRVLLQEDCSSAHQSLDRKYSLAQYHAYAPMLCQPFAAWYGRPTTCTWYLSGGRRVTVPSECGFWQGDPFANAGFAVAIVEPTRDLKAEVGGADPNLSVYQDADDLQLVTSRTTLPEISPALRRHWAPTGLTFNDVKRQTFSHDPAPLPDSFQQCRVDYLRCLGPGLSVEDPTTPAAVTIGDLSSQHQGLKTAQQNVQYVHSRLQELREHGLPLQTGQSLFRTMVSSQTQHIISAKCVPPAVTRVWDDALRGLWDSMIGVAHSDQAWQQASLPQRDGGCGLGLIGKVAAPAFLAAQSRIHPFVVRHCGLDSVDQLLSVDSVFAQDVAGAVQGVRGVVGPAASVPWAHGVVPTMPFRQQRLTQLMQLESVKRFKASLTPSAATAFLSAGGPGAGGFLWPPSNSDVAMDDVSFRVAYCRRLGGGLRPLQMEQQCCHVGRTGQCSQQIDAMGHHGRVCPTGGFVIKRHDRVLQWLAAWLNQGRIHSPALCEQLCPDEAGRLDIAFHHDAKLWWVDVEVTSAVNTVERVNIHRARHAGAAARDGEQQKRARYNNRAIPFILEANGRPGQSAQAFIRRFAADAASGFSTSAADAWRDLSSVLQSGNAQLELSAYGAAALEQQCCELFMPG